MTLVALFPLSSLQDKGSSKLASILFVEQEFCVLLNTKMDWFSHSSFKIKLHPPAQLIVPPPVKEEEGKRQQDLAELKRKGRGR